MRRPITRPGPTSQAQGRTLSPPCPALRGTKGEDKLRPYKTVAPVARGAPGGTGKHEVRPYDLPDPPGPDVEQVRHGHPGQEAHDAQPRRNDDDRRPRAAAVPRQVRGRR